MYNEARMHNQRWFYLYILAGIVVSLSIVWSWTGGSALIMGHDSGYRLILREFFGSLFYAWSPAIAFGVSTLFNPAVVSVHIPEVIASFLSADHVMRQTIVLTFWHVFNLMAIVFSYRLVRPFVFKNAHWVAIVASVLYAINFLNLHAWSVLWRTKFTTQFVLPLLVFFLYRTLQEGKLHTRLLLVVAIVVALCNGGGSPPLYGPLLLAWILTGLFVASVHRFAARTVALFFKTSILLFGVFCLLSSYWLVPYGMYAISSYTSELQAQGGIDAILQMVDAVSKNASFLNIFRLQGLPAWDAQSVFPFMLTYMKSPVLIFISFLWFGLALSAYFLAREKQEKLFVGLLFFLMVGGALFTAATHGPTGMLFRAAMYEIPGFGIFRTAFYKFGMIVWFALSMLSAYALMRISQNVAGALRRSALFLLSMALCIVGIFWYHAPFLRGEFFAYNRPFTNLVNVPEYVHQTAAFIHATGTAQDRILLLPRFDVDRMDGYAWGYWGPDPFPRLVINRPIVSDAYSPPRIVDALYRALEEERYADFLILIRLSGIRYILWRDDALYSDKKTLGSEFHLTEKALSELSGITRVAGFGQWRVYSVDPQYQMPQVGVFLDHIVSNQEYEDYLRILPGNTDQENLPFITAATRASGKSTLIGALCIVCRRIDEQYLRAKVTIEQVQLTPISKVYPWLLWWEERKRSKISANHEESIRLIYKQIGKRLAEMRKMLHTANSAAVASVITQQVALQLAAAEQLLMKLSALNQRSVAADMQHMLLSYLFLTQEWGSHPVRDLLEAHMQQLGNRFPEVALPSIDKTINQRVFVVEIPASGVYAVHPVVDGGYEQLRINNQIVTSDSVYLSSGIHRVDVFVSSSEEENAQIYFSQPHTAIAKPVPANMVTMQSNVSHVLRITDAKDPFFVYLNDLFDPGWTATIVTPSGREEISSADHRKLNGFANAWYIEHTGSFDIHLTYAPQWYIWWGMTIAVIAWVGCITYLFLPIKKQI